ncbi:DUF930 domain-containing protein [Roseibium sp. MMSF_3412]|uniref:DUF930 domain-containing protein n=1 Tax=Roseibium sp. MMSF_3412 TaxID=3046712 RepID=UPI00273E725C|nr:DUF930 domain-containing protein [Roseibium sp. MMSF_3412]
MAIIADMNRPMIEAAKEDRQTFTWGLATSLVLHGALALVLLGGISGYVTEPGQEPVEVEIITLPAPAEEDAAAEEQAEDQPQSEEQPEEQDEQEENLPPEPAPEQEETEEETEEPPPEPAPAPEEEETADTPPPPSIQEAVQEFAEEDPEPQDTELQPLQEPVEEEVAETEETQETEETEPLDEAEQIADAGTEDSDVAEDVAEEVAEEVNEDVVTSEPADEPAIEEDLAETDTAEADAPDEELPEQDVPEEEIVATEETTPDTPLETEVADDFDPLAGPVSETETDVTPEPQPKPVELAEAGTEAEVNVGDADEIAPDDFGTVGPIVSAAPPAPKPARQVARATPSASSSASSSAGTVRRPGHIQARQIYSANNPRITSRMRGLTEGERLSLLCMTELDAQLTAVSPVPPEALPRARARGGTVLEYQRVAFRSLGRWFDIAFRCETNAGVTRVERFSFKIGEEIPRSQWLARGLSQF